MFVSTLDQHKSLNLPSACIHAITEAMELVQDCIPADGQYGLSEKTNNAKAIIMRYHTKSYAEALYETHTQMTDIQIVLDGEEYCYVRQSSDLTVEKTGDDIEFYKEKPQELARVHLVPGAFVLISPKEAHAPGVSPTDFSVAVTKLVIKIEL